MTHKSTYWSIVCNWYILRINLAMWDMVSHNIFIHSSMLLLNKPCIIQALLWTFFFFLLKFPVSELPLSIYSDGIGPKAFFRGPSKKYMHSLGLWKYIQWFDILLTHCWMQSTDDRPQLVNLTFTLPITTSVIRGCKMHKLLWAVIPYCQIQLQTYVPSNHWVNGRKTHWPEPMFIMQGIIGLFKNSSATSTLWNINQ